PLAAPPAGPHRSADCLHRWTGLPAGGLRCVLPRCPVLPERAAHRLVLWNAGGLFPGPGARGAAAPLRGQPDGLADFLLPIALVLRADARLGVVGGVRGRGPDHAGGRLAGLRAAEAALRGGSLMPAAVTLEDVSTR